MPALQRLLIRRALQYIQIAAPVQQAVFHGAPIRGGITAQFPKIYRTLQRDLCARCGPL